MSPLTKLFVVLLVLVSVALSAGTITFVNKLDPLQKQLTAARTQAANSEALLDKAKSTIDANGAALAAMQQANTNETAAIRSERLKLLSDVAERDKQIAQLQNNLAVVTSSINSQSTALNASEGAKTLLQEQVTGLRKDADERLRQLADSGQRINKLTADLEQTERARRALAEQLTDASGKADRLSKLMRDMGVPDTQLANAGTGLGAPPLNGVIRSRRNIAGKDYATISIGSSDEVRKGMRFNIIDKESGSFLGVMTVEVVESNEAIGQIAADPQNLAQIRAGNVVRTQS